MRILVVENDHAIASTLQRNLTHGHYAVDLATDDATALRLARDGADRYDIILIDLACSTSSVDLPQRLRQQGIQSPFLLTSHLNGISPPSTLGPDDYFVVPLNPAMLTTWVQSLVPCGRAHPVYPTQGYTSRPKQAPLSEPLGAVSDGSETAEQALAKQTDRLKKVQHQLIQERQQHQRAQQRLKMERHQVEIRLQQQWNRERLIAQITQSIRQTLDLDQILQVAVDEVRHLLQTDRVVLFGLQTENRGTIAAESVGPGWLALLGTNIRDDCFKNDYIDRYRQGRVSAVSDIYAAHIQSCYLDLLRGFEVRANLVVPILQETELWGLLIAHHCEAPRIWEPDHIQLLIQVAAQLGIAIQQAELYQQARRELLERRHIQAALQDSEERFRSLAAFAPVGIYQTDRDGHCIYTNACWQQIAGLTFEECLGTGWERSIHPADRSKVFAAWSRFVHEGQPFALEFRFQTPAGKVRWVYGLATAIYAGADEVVGYVGINEDITERKRAEQLEAQFQQAQRLESLGRLASGIAHDLNNVLTPILAIAQLLRLPQHPLDPQTKSHLELVERSAKRGASMVKQILTFARGSYEEASPVDLQRLLDDVVEMARKSFPETIQIRYSPAITAVPTIVLAAPTQLHQVFMNLCVNARDAMPDGGELSVLTESVTIGPEDCDEMRHSALKPGLYIQVTVSDTGSGIAPEVRDRIFEPFFTTKAVGQGTGLGLATALGIVKNYGGFLEVESEVGEGTAVNVYLPATTKHPQSHYPEARVQLGQGQGILVIDDDSAVRQSTQSLLAHHGYQAMAADDTTALDIFKRHQAKIALIIVDVMMPETDGIALLRHMKAIAPDIKAVVSSGLLEHQEAARAAGADSFLVKPYDLGELLRELGELLLSE